MNRKTISGIICLFLVICLICMILPIGCNPPIPPWPTTTTSTQPTPTTTTTTIPVPKPSTFTAIFDHSESRDYWKCGSLYVNNEGLFTGIINDKSRQNIELWLNGKFLRKGSQETISQPIEFNGVIYYPTESDGDKAGWKYTNGLVTDTCNLRHSAASIIYKGQPCYISSENRGEMIINAMTGSDVMKLNVAQGSGIPFAACYLPGDNNEIVIALYDGDGKEGFVTTTGIYIQCTGATAVELWNGNLMGAAKSKILNIQLSNKSTSVFYDTGSSYINQLWYDQENNILWASCSGPDKLIYFDSDKNVHEVIKMTSGSGSGAFQTRIVKGWWVGGQKANWYKIIKTPIK